MHGCALNPDTEARITPLEAMGPRPSTAGYATLPGFPPAAWSIPGEPGAALDEAVDARGRHRRRGLLCGGTQRRRVRTNVALGFFVPQRAHRCRQILQRLARGPSLKRV